jgi:hypothetical protein
MDRENDTDRKTYRQRDTNTDNKYLHNNYIIINGEDDRSTDRQIDEKMSGRIERMTNRKIEKKL